MSLNSRTPWEKINPRAVAEACMCGCHRWGDAYTVRGSSQSSALTTAESLGAGNPLLSSALTACAAKINWEILL